MTMPIVANQMEKPAKLKNGGVISGRLVFAELSEQGNQRARELAIEAADLAFADGDGKPLEAMPFHNEMSDAVFMAGPILARAGSLTGNPKYLDQSIRQLRFIRNLCLRQDELYRHSPLHEAAWGRGNGFPAIGIAMMLEHLPENHEDYTFCIECLQDHLRALKPHQDENGMWHQVIDHPESYAEFTCTCMISYAILVGIRNGWLSKDEWKPAIEKSWQAVKGRISLSGKEVYGACTGTGKQKSLDAYFMRKEINGYDDRGGAMALLFASEMKRFLSEGE